MKYPVIPDSRNRLLTVLLAVGLTAVTGVFAAGQTSSAAKKNASDKTQTQAKAANSQASSSSSPTTADAAQSGSSSSDVYVLSPFQVSTERDSGYQATNSISGSRLNTPIKDIPMPIEVITDQFVKDTGATDLRSALQYSAGILLKTQNDLDNTSYQGPGGVNNPQGATANTNEVQVKLRGFVTNNALRDGFVRQNSTDAVNIRRVEVVRGPAALLYGTGNFGGVVNYLVKQPLDHPFHNFNVSYGTYDFMRSTVDLTGPINTDQHLDYRFTGAWQQTKDQTQYYKEHHYFMSPAFSWKPTSTTDVYADFEYGKQWQKGTGFRAMRSVAGVGVNNDQNEHGGFYYPPGADPKTFRLSGPDTYQNNQASNAEFKVTQKLLPGLYAFAGYNWSKYDDQSRDVIGNLTTSTGPVALQQTVDLFPISSGGDSSLNIQNGPTPNVIDQYTWTSQDRSTVRKQYRIEMTYSKTLFGHANHWVRLKNTFLVGYSNLSNDINLSHYQTIPNAYDFKAPMDLNPIVFGTQGDGSQDQPMYKNDVNEAKAWDKAGYFTYQARFLDDRVLLLWGVRNDHNDAWSYDEAYSAPGADPTTSSLSGDTQKQNTYQRGISVKITDWLSVYGLKSEGIQPNFSGQIQAANGKPAGSSMAKSREWGIKFDFFGGRVTGTVSHYDITKTAWTGAPWYSPATLGSPRFNPNKDIVYNVNNFTPSGVTGGGNGGVSDGQATAVLDQPAVKAAWDAAVASGAAFYSSAGSSDGSSSWYVDATKTDGAAYMDAAFAANQSLGGAEWPGWLYNGESGDSLVNNATMDAMGFHGGNAGSAAIQTTDESHGWDGQVMIKATKDLQFVLSGAITTVRRTSFGTWMKYPYPQDRWAVWYFQNGSWGLLGLPISQIYTDPTDTSTRTSAGQAAGDDTPKYHFDFWTDYKFEGALKGLSVGLGGYYESKRQYLSGVTHGSGQLITDPNGKLVILYTPSRTNINAMVKYAWKSGNHDQYVQLNVQNVLNDQKLYGLIYANPMTAKLTYSMNF